MTDADRVEEASLFPKTAGEKLRDAREAGGLSLAEVAARTRVPTRHLEAIERSDYSGLPSPTYSIGFAKAYARAVGLDEVAIGREVRGQADATHRPTDYQPYEMQDPKRLPPKGLATAVGLIAALIVIAVGIWYGTNLFRGDGSAPTIETAAEVSPPPAVALQAPPAAPTGGQVALTATDVVWLRIYDASGKSLFEKELQPGERYEVPADADRPMINVGRPDKLVVTVNGSSVPPLGDGERAIKDVGVSAQALLARGNAAAPAAANTSPVQTPPAFSDTTADGSRSTRTAPSSRPKSTRNSADKRPATRSSDAEETARANAASAATPPVASPSPPQPNP